VKTYRFNIWTEKFNIFDLKEDAIMDSKKAEFSEALSEMSQFAGALVGAAVVAGKKVIRCVNDLTIVETHIEPSTDPVKDNSEVKSKTD
jgi:hypothetical protein